MCGERVPGVLGPLEDCTEVKDDCEDAWELAAEEIELTRGDDPTAEYACGGCGRCRDGNRSPTLNGRRAMLAYGLDASDGPRVCTRGNDGRSSLSVFLDHLRILVIEKGVCGSCLWFLSVVSASKGLHLFAGGGNGCLKYAEFVVRLTVMTRLSRRFVQSVHRV